MSKTASYIGQHHHFEGDMFKVSPPLDGCTNIIIGRIPGYFIVNGWSDEGPNLDIRELVVPFSDTEQETVQEVVGELGYSIVEAAKPDPVCVDSLGALREMISLAESALEVFRENESPDSVASKNWDFEVVKNLRGSLTKLERLYS